MENIETGEDENYEHYLDRDFEELKLEEDYRHFLIKGFLQRYKTEQDIIDAIENKESASHLTPDTKNNILISLAAHKNYIELARLLLTKYKDTINPAVDNNEPLLSASIMNYPEIVKLLLNDSRVRDPEVSPENCLIEAAIEDNYIDIVKIFLKHKDINLHGALTKAIERMDRFYEYIFSIDVYSIEELDDELRVPIENNFEIIKLLLEDSRVNPTEIPSETLYTMLSNNLQFVIKVLQLFIKDGRVNFSFDNSKIVDLCAISPSYLNCLKLLLKDPRIDPSAENNRALDTAVFKRNENAVKLLLDDIRVDPEPYDMTSLPIKTPMSPIDADYLRLIKHNNFLEKTVQRLSNQIKKQSAQIEELTYAPHSENFPYGGIEVGRAQSRFEKAKLLTEKNTDENYKRSRTMSIEHRKSIYDNKDREFRTLYNYCVEEKSLPDRNEEYEGVKIGKLLRCIINNDFSCKNNREQWLNMLKSIPHIRDELNMKLDAKPEENTDIIESLDED